MSANSSSRTRLRAESHCQQSCESVRRTSGATSRSTKRRAVCLRLLLTFLSRRDSYEFDRSDDACRQRVLARRDPGPEDSRYNLP
jgi:hypothetical protein